MELIEKKSLASKVIETRLINWRNLEFIQQPGFKELTDQARHKLKSSLVEYVQGCIMRYINFCNKKGIVINFTHINGNLKINDFDYEKK